LRRQTNRAARDWRAIDSVLIILGPREDELAAIIIIAIPVADFLQHAGIYFNASFEFKIAKRDRVPDGEGPLAFEFQWQVNEGILAVVSGSAFCKSLCACWQIKSGFKCCDRNVTVLGAEVTPGAITYSCGVG